MRCMYDQSVWWPSGMQANSRGCLVPLKKKAQPFFGCEEFCLPLCAFVDFRMKFEKFDEEEQCVKGLFVNHPRLRSANEVPAYLVDNPHITEGFRLLATHWDAFKSMFYMHNCWLDAWTSVLTGVQAVVLLLISACVPTAQWAHGASDRTCLVLFFLMGILHSPSSVVYHMYGHAGISEFWFLFYQRLDFFMIFFSMNFLAVALAWYPWGHAPFAIAAVGCIALCFSMFVLYNIRKPITPHQRITMIACQVLITMSPVLHQMFQDVVSGRFWSRTFLWGFGIFVWLGFGAVTYGGKIPERWVPNHPFNGHAWMHIGVNGALYCEWQFIRAAFQLYQHNHTHTN